VKNNVKLFNN